MCGSDISSLPISDHREIRQIAVVVQEQMEFNGPFGLTEVAQGNKLKQRSTVVESRLSSLFFKRNFFFLTGLSLRQKSRRWKKNVLIKFPGTVGINIGQCAFGRVARNPK